MCAFVGWGFKAAIKPLLYFIRCSQSWNLFHCQISRVSHAITTCGPSAVPLTSKETPFQNYISKLHWGISMCSHPTTFPTVQIRKPSLIRTHGALPSFVSQSNISFQTTKRLQGRRYVVELSCISNIQRYCGMSPGSQLNPNSMQSWKSVRERSITWRHQNPSHFRFQAFRFVQMLADLPDVCGCTLFQLSKCTFKLSGQCKINV